MAQHTPIPGFTGYEITREGNVYSVAHNWRGYGLREMRQSPNSDGYPSVRLVVGGKRSRFAVHKLVALAFLPERPSDQHQVRHLDGNKLRPGAENLAWGTPLDNAEDRELHGRTSRGLSHSAFILRGLSVLGAVR